jgi:hypothetical protein
MVVAQERSTFVMRARRGWRRFTTSITAAYWARRRKKRFFRRMLDDVFAFGVLVVAAWVAVNLIAHLTN